MVGEDEDGSMEGRVGAPPSLPLRVLVPTGIAELARAHDLGADAGVMQPYERVVEAAAAARLADHLVPPPGGQQPLMQPVAGVAERRFAGQPFAGSKTVERDGEELDARDGHD